MSLRRLKDDQSGMTIIEMLAGIIAFTAISGAIMQMTIAATHNQDRIAERVAANQKGRPTLTRIMDNLRSGCVASRVTPVQAGSTSTQMSYLSKQGSEVNPTPDRRVLTYTPPTGSNLGGTLSEQIFPATGGTAPVWTFSGTPVTNFTSPPRSPPVSMNGVVAPGGVMFRYYDYVNGQLNANPLPVPLSSTNAARTAYVTVSISFDPSLAAPGSSGSYITSANRDVNSPITLTDSVDLRLESAAPLAAVDNPPCT